MDKRCYDSTDRLIKIQTDHWALPDLKEMAEKEANVLVSWNSLMLFFKDFLAWAASDMQQGKQLIFAE